jgi:hypothetical protein
MAAGARALKTTAGLQPVWWSEGDSNPRYRENFYIGGIWPKSGALSGLKNNNSAAENLFASDSAPLFGLWFRSFAASLGISISYNRTR